MGKNEVKYGAILSYIFIIINSVYGLFVTPYILGTIGSTEYGVYKTIASLSSSLMVLDLGLGGTVMRYVAKYNALKESDKINSFISMALVECFILICVVFAVCTGVFKNLGNIYRNGLNESEVMLAQNLFMLLSVNMIMHIFENLLNGVLTGFNRFTVANSLKLIRIIFRIILLFVILPIYKSSLVIVSIDVVLTFIMIAIEYMYAILRLHVRVSPNFKNWDMTVFKESFVYTLLLFLTSIASQINSNLDKVVIGAMKGAAAVTVYSMGLLIFGMFENLSCSISSVMLPTVTNVLCEDDGYRKVQKLIIKCGRIQFLFMIAAFSGFAVLGKDFINIWLGNGYDDVHIIALILMGPAMLELCVNVCLSILRAENRLKFRTFILFGTTALNAIITVVGCKYGSYIWAAIGTSASFLIGSIVIMNIYYHKVFGFNMLKIYLKIFDGIWICALISTIAIIISSSFMSKGLITFIINVVIYVAAYAVTLLMFGLKKDEKAYILKKHIS